MGYLNTARMIKRFVVESQYFSFLEKRQNQSPLTRHDRKRGFGQTMERWYVNNVVAGVKDGSRRFRKDGRIGRSLWRGPFGSGYHAKCRKRLTHHGGHRRIKKSATSS
jgi:hypothetical protein